MKLKLFLFITAVIFASCTEKNVTDPLTYMDRRQQREVIDKFVRYATKLAPTSSRESMFNSQFDSYYDRAALELNFVHLQPAEDGGYYFLFSRPARSIIPMFEGVGGKLKLNEKDSLIEYEEVFRTWKMEDKDLKSRGKYLFNSMVRGEDLSPFYSKKAGDKYIEFPDDRFRFDKEKRRWMDTSTDTIDFFNKTDSITLNQ